MVWENKRPRFYIFTINRDGWVIVIDKNKTTLITIYQVDLGLGVDFNKQYISEIKKYVSDELNSIEELKQNYDAKCVESNIDIENLKEQNKILQSEIEYNNNQIKLIEQQKKLEMENVSLKEKQLHKKIEKFIGAKIF